jgi:hypothetical protein
MGKVENVFEDAWNRVVKMYKQDWTNNLQENGKNGIKYFPDNFYSEADLKSQLTCLLRTGYENEKFHGQKIYVKNELTFNPESFPERPELSGRMKKLQSLVNDQANKTRFIPDIAIESDSTADGGAFLVFAELKFWTDFMLKYRNDVPKYFRGALKNLEVQCKTLQLALERGVCKSGYVCVISDGYFSHDGWKKEFDDMSNKYNRIRFLVGGMPVKEKLKFLEEQEV